MCQTHLDKKSDEGSMTRIIIGAIGLAALWLLMSGLYKPLVLFLGFCSVLLSVYVANRMDEKDDDSRLEYTIGVFSTFKYLCWLLVEIVKSNWAVTKIILSPGKQGNQNLFVIPVSCKTEMGQVVYANSITLTPGTITVESEGECFIVHALDYSDDDLESLADMDARVRKIETGGGA